ncbi:MAG: hypothetical protein KDE22_17065 [Rhodobacterales bacterium]|nr:hypothetical protein [Rhodobacterales bacterium]
MRSCESCPGGVLCTAENLYPMLRRVYDLHAGGLTDKFDILDALDEDDEALLDKYNNRITRDCWSKAALLTLADVVAERCAENPADVAAVVADVFHQGKSAFQAFPWHLPDLVDQAPDLYAIIAVRLDDAQFADPLGKRAFVKLCKAASYG